MELLEALALERLKRQRDVSEASNNREVARTVLGMLAERLNEHPVPKWLFALDGDSIKIFYDRLGTPREVGSWAVDDSMRLVMGEATTEWITSESMSRAIDQAVQATAKLIVDIELTENRLETEVVA